ncbi:MAG: S-methyl-5-thioribose-1-phosphate isomerase [Anaerolineaceae bacterium]|nr:S-methyl-5-thioribose-1-phosphate isomerase [Anaerolineaceae bacterium]
MDNKKTFDLETVYLDDENNALVIIDQTLIPIEVKYLHLTEQEDIWEAIYELRVRGAPAIGITAGYGAYLGVKASKAQDYESFYQEFKKVKDYLASSRPTAVNLFWALDKMDACVKKNKNRSIPEIIEALHQQSEEIKAEDVRTNKAIGEYGLSLVQPNTGLLTHCNAGSLATGKYGTATAPMYLGHERGYNFKVFADETRPLLQGARITTFELAQAGIDVTLIADNMASTVMKNGWVQAVFVGCDRVAANGDVANKIGTSGVAILAHEYGIPFYVCAPTSTIDMNCPTGADIEIEQRNPEEVYKKWYAKPMAPEEGVKFFNPAFDVSDAKYVTAIITEFGIARPPFDITLKQIMDKKAQENA